MSYSLKIHNYAVSCVHSTDNRNRIVSAFSVVATHSHPNSHVKIFHVIPKMVEEFGMVLYEFQLVATKSTELQLYASVYANHTDMRNIVSRDLFVRRYVHRMLKQLA